MTALPDPHHQPEFYAGVPSKRLLAWIIDSIIIFVLCFLASLLTLGIGFFLWVLLWLVLGFAYRFVTIASGSATWGMRTCAIELRNGHDHKLDSTEAFLHTPGYTISVSIPILQVISVVLMLVSERKQGLSDHILGTSAVNRAV